MLLSISIPTVQLKMAAEEIDKLADPLTNDGHTTKTKGVYNQPVFGNHFLQLMHTIAQHSCLRIIKPCSTFGRICETGAILIPHIDRDPLDWTISIPLNQKSAEWPIYVKNIGPQYIPLNYGILMNGKEVEHWREPCENGPSIWMLLHYTNV